MIIKHLILAFATLLVAGSLDAAFAAAPVLKAGEHILLPSGASVFAKAGGKAGQKLTNNVAFEVLRVEQGWLALRPVRSCYGAGLVPYAVTLWTPATSVATVVTKKVTRRFDDGSGYTLYPGLRVRPGDGTDGSRVELDQKVSLPGGGLATGASYRWNKRSQSPALGLKVAKPTVDGRAISLEAEPLYRKTPRAGVFATDAHCWSLEVRVQGKPEGPFTEVAVAIEAAATVPTGTALLWPDGTAVGKAVADTAVWEAQREAVGVCWRDHGVRLCAKADAVRVHHQEELKETPRSAGAKARQAERCKGKSVFSFGKCRSPDDRVRLRKAFKHRDIKREMAKLERRLAEAKNDDAASAKLSLSMANLAMERYLALEIAATVDGAFKMQLLKKSLVAKAGELRRVKNAFVRVLAYKNPDITSCAALGTGRLYEVFARELSNTQIPEGLTASQKAEYTQQLDELSAPIREQAAATYRAAAKEAKRKGVSNRCTKETLARLTQIDARLAL